jgi:hypothetical protein
MREVWRRVRPQAKQAEVGDEPMEEKPNHSIQRMGASRSAQRLSVTQWRLAPAADAGRSAE